MGALTTIYQWLICIYFLCPCFLKRRLRKYCKNKSPYSVIDAQRSIQIDIFMNYVSHLPSFLSLSFPIEPQFRFFWFVHLPVYVSNSITSIQLWPKALDANNLLWYHFFSHQFGYITISNTGISNQATRDLYLGTREEVVFISHGAIFWKCSHASLAI